MFVFYFETGKTNPWWLLSNGLERARAFCWIALRFLNDDDLNGTHQAPRTFVTLPGTGTACVSPTPPRSVRWYLITVTTVPIHRCDHGLQRPYRVQCSRE